MLRAFQVKSDSHHNPMLETFDHPELDPRLQWYCPPQRWSIANGCLVIEPDAQTDYWQKTHYGFAVDNGHFLYLPVDGDFVLSTQVRFYPVHQYDQAGLMVRFSADRWLKTSVEFEPDEPDRLGAVVTRHGYSDWSTQNYPYDSKQLALRIRREADDYIVEYAKAIASDTESEKHWTQIRMAHLENPEQLPIQCGVYACSPKGSGFRAEFDYLKVEEGRI
ncbi:MAG: DUF1349 domain-containing protein [Elainellaceae cyanobacterium]